MFGTSISSWVRRFEVGRLITGSFAELLIKAYGAGAVVSVAISDAEDVRGKAGDAVAAVPTLVDEYRDAQYVVEHQEEIRSAINYLDEHTPAQSELEQAVESGSETLQAIETTRSELERARDAVGEFDLSLATFGRADEAFGHVKTAWEAKPDLASLRELAAIAEHVGPLAEQVDVLAPVYYAGVVPVTDNFAGDEIMGTLGVMALVLAITFVLGHLVGFWIRRGRPGLIARAVQWAGAHVFRRWYVRNLPHALGTPLYSAARERLQQDIVADPQAALDPEVLRELETYFASRSEEDSLR